MSIILVEIKDASGIEHLRLVRNHCRLYMTRNTSEISTEQQALWYSNLDRTTNKIYLLHEIHCGVAATVIGYAYLRIEDGCVLLSGGLLPDDRGKGHGTVLFEYLVDNAKKFNKPIKLEVLKSNMKAFSIYNKIGFRVVSDDGKVITMEYYYDSTI